MCVRLDETANMHRSNCTWQTKFCRFLHEHKENVVHTLDVFLHLHLCSRTVHLISAFKQLFATHQLWFFICLPKISLLFARDASLASGTAHADLCVLAFRAGFCWAIESLGSWLQTAHLSRWNKSSIAIPWVLGVSCSLEHSDQYCTVDGCAIPSHILEKL